MLVDRVCNCSVSPYDDVYLLHLPCKLSFCHTSYLVFNPTRHNTQYPKALNEIHSSSLVMSRCQPELVTFPWCHKMGFLSETFEAIYLGDMK